MGIEIEYGHSYPGLDPRRFQPDTQVNTPEEIEAHAKALQQVWETGKWDCPGGGLEAHESGIILHSDGAWGWGIITYEDDGAPDEDMG